MTELKKKFITNQEYKLPILTVCKIFIIVIRKSMQKYIRIKIRNLKSLSSICPNFSMQSLRFFPKWSKFRGWKIMAWKDLNEAILPPGYLLEMCRHSITDNCWSYHSNSPALRWDKLQRKCSIWNPWGSCIQVLSSTGK